MRNQAYESLRNTLRDNAKKTHTPLFAVFELTGRCNLNCKMCYIHTADNSALQADELTTAQWKQIIDEAYDCGMMFAVLTGGECMLRRDFREIYLHLYEKGIRITVNTNGLLLTEDNVAFFQAHRPEEIQVSLYGANDNDYEAVTERRAFAQVAAGLRRLQDAGIDFHVAVTPSQYMMGGYKAILDYLSARNISYKIEQHLIPTLDGSDNSASMLSEADYISILKYDAKVRGRKPEPRLNPPKAGGKANAAARGLKCNAGMCLAYVNFRGFMQPCISLPWESVSVVERGFRAAWEVVNACCLQVQLPAKCDGCAYEKQCSPCPAVRCLPDDVTQCRIEQCRFMERKCAEGLLRVKQEQPE